MNKSLKKGWMKFYAIFIVAFMVASYLILKYDFLYLSPIVIILFGFAERRFMKDSRDIEWKDLKSIFHK